MNERTTERHFRADIAKDKRSKEVNVLKCQYLTNWTLFVRSLFRIRNADFCKTFYVRVKGVRDRGSGFSVYIVAYGTDLPGVSTETRPSKGCCSTARYRGISNSDMTNVGFEQSRWQTRVTTVHRDLKDRS